MITLGYDDLYCVGKNLFHWIFLQYNGSWAWQNVCQARNSRTRYLLLVIICVKERQTGLGDWVEGERKGHFFWVVVCFLSPLIVSVLVVDDSFSMQLADMFDLEEEEVEGYEPPSLITELHTHLNSCSVEYRWGDVYMILDMIFDTFAIPYLWHGITAILSHSKTVRDKYHGLLWGGGEHMRNFHYFPSLTWIKVSLLW